MKKMADIKVNFNTGLTMPWKLLRCGEALRDGRIRPLHIRLYPTYRCNAACRFCVDRTQYQGEELPLSELLELLKCFHGLGTRAITLTGGGEPTLHPGFDVLLDFCRELDIQLGLITNGLLWSGERKKLSANGKLVWARMSVVDAESGAYDVERLRRFSENLPDVMVGCYATITSGTDVNTIVRLAELAESLPNVTHFKLGEDSVNGAADKIDELSVRLASGHKKVIIHRQAGAVQGNKKCLVSLLRPVIGADGYVYPCCNLKLDKIGYVNPTRFRMGYWRDFAATTHPFDGSVCPECIFDSYNQALAQLLEPMECERFI
jgi:organic radical activating enzyme